MRQNITREEKGTIVSALVAIAATLIGSALNSWIKADEE